MERSIIVSTTGANSNQCACIATGAKYSNGYANAQGNTFYRSYEHKIDMTCIQCEDLEYIRGYWVCLDWTGTTDLDTCMQCKFTRQRNHERELLENG